ALARVLRLALPPLRPLARHHHGVPAQGDLARERRPAVFEKAGDPPRRRRPTERGRGNAGGEMTEAQTLSRREKPGAETPLLVVEDLAISFGGIKAVDGLSFSVRQGEIVSVIGPNGAGKTSA